MDSKELFGEEIEKETPEQAQEVAEEKQISEQVYEVAEETGKKGSNPAVVALVTALFILVIGLCIYIAVTVSSMVPEGGKEDKEYEAQTQDPWEEILGEDYKEENAEEPDAAEPEVEQDVDISEDEETAETPEDVFSDISEYEYPNYNKDAFTGQYYEETVDCMDETVSYEMERKFYNIKEPEHNVNIHTSYIQLSGDIPGMEEINRILEQDAVYFAKNYEENKQDILEVLEGNTGIDASIRSYVTYNTENMVSIVIREDISMGYAYTDVRLRGYNINTETGTILDNTSILKLDTKFAQEFRDRSNRQNGADSMDLFTDDQIEELLADETSLILFYTPYGIELGFNYRSGGYKGWITITMQDYEKYVPLM